MALPKQLKCGRSPAVRFVVSTAVVVALAVVVSGRAAQDQVRPTPGRSPETPVATRVPTPPVVDHTALIREYCVTCHNERRLTGGLSLATFNANEASSHPAIAEKVIRKLRAGMMPPPGVRRPDAAALSSVVESLEQQIDAAAVARPNPGWRPSPRLTRAEYARAIDDLLGITIDVDAFLPPDTISNGFDNIADTQMISPSLVQGYLRAASEISRLAVGDRNAGASSTTWKVPRTASQMRHVEGAPLGTRGGLSVVHMFPADGEYVFKTMLHMDPTGDLYGAPQRGEQLEISTDGGRAALLDVDPHMTEEGGGVTIESTPVHITAGPHRLSAAFLARFDGPVDDLIRQVEQTLADTNIGSAFGVTALPHVRDFSVTGPLKVTGMSETPSRRAIFTCRPVAADEELPCATSIVKRLATQAYRGLVSADDVRALMAFYEKGRASGGFESGIRLALQAILASPRFLLRAERGPANVAGGQTYHLGDMELASRLSFFLWGTLPDQELLDIARSGRLSAPAVYDKQLRRLLKDPRSSALATRFGSQWLRLQDVEKVRPDSHLFPQWDATLSAAMIRETELFVESLIREDRSVLELITADYTFVNERLAKHYRIPNVIGSEFRRVALPDERRRGILGHGSILLQTSMADRTSPVLRGKWVMEVLLGTPPPPPPPNVPDLEATESTAGTRMLSVRERLEVHRKSPACSSCHRMIDPLGLALENFDATGAWRLNDNGNMVDPAGELYDGTKIDGPVALRFALLKRQKVVVQSFTEGLMTYALGRRVEYYDMPVIRAIVRDAQRQGLRFSTFVVGVANSAAFRSASLPAAPIQTAATSTVPY